MKKNTLLSCFDLKAIGRGYAATQQFKDGNTHSKYSFTTPTKTQIDLDCSSEPHTISEKQSILYPFDQTFKKPASEFKLKPQSIDKEYISTLISKINKAPINKIIIEDNLKRHLDECLLENNDIDALESQLNTIIGQLPSRNYNFTYAQIQIFKEIKDELLAKYKIKEMASEFFKKPVEIEDFSGENLEPYKKFENYADLEPLKLLAYYCSVALKSEAYLSNYENNSFITTLKQFVERECLSEKTLTKIATQIRDIAEDGQGNQLKYLESLELGKLNSTEIKRLRAILFYKEKGNFLNKLDAKSRQHLKDLHIRKYYTTVEINEIARKMKEGAQEGRESQSEDFKKLNLEFLLPKELKILRQILQAPDRNSIVDFFDDIYPSSISYLQQLGICKLYTKEAIFLIIDEITNKAVTKTLDIDYLKTLKLEVYFPEELNIFKEILFEQYPEFFTKVTKKVAYYFKNLGVNKLYTEEDVLVMAKKIYNLALNGSQHQLAQVEALNLEVWPKDQLKQVIEEINAMLQKEGSTLSNELYSETLDYLIEELGVSKELIQTTK